YVMEFLDGHSLRTELELRGGKMSPAEYWQVLSQVAEGLSFAHTMNVVHRDVKPDNIFLLNDGRVKLTDFGIARAADYEQTHLTKTGVMMGTLAYVSPEQLQDAKNVDHRADIFSLGVVSYESLSGQVPFTGDGIAQTIVKIVSQEEKPLHILVPYISVEISTTVTKALRKRARERYRSVMEFAKEFESALNSSRKDQDGEPQPQPQPGSPKVSFMVTQPGGFVKADEVKELRSLMSEALSSSSPAPAQPKRTDSEVTDPPGASHPSSRAGQGGLPFQPGQLAPPSSQAGGAAKPGSSGAANFLSPPARSNERSPYGGQPVSARGPTHSDIPAYLLKPVRMIESFGKERSRLVEPCAICYRSGRLIVADNATRKVHMFSLDGRWMGDLTYRSDSRDTKTRGGSLTKPSGIAIDMKGRIYVSDSSDPYIRVFDSRGIFVNELCNIQGKEGGVAGITIDSTGMLYLSDIVNGAIQVFQSDLGLWMRTIGTKGPKENQFQLPAGLASDRLNQIYCADYGQSKIFVFNKSGAFVRAFGGKGTANGLFNVPRAVAVDSNDKIYVLDSLNHRVQVFGPTGEYFYTIGGRGQEPGRFMGPADLSIDVENNQLYIADKGNERVQVFELSQK
ncbi:MAG TPA: protein kinase, partial [Chroococcales cyanobacterium]